MSCVQPSQCLSQTEKPPGQQPVWLQKWTIDRNCLALSCWSPKICKSGFQVFITYFAGSVRCFWYGQKPDPPVNPIEKGHLRNSSGLSLKSQIGPSKVSWRGEVSKSQHLVTGVPLLAGLPANSIKPLQLIQNAAARLIFNEPKRMHVTHLFINLHWLPIVARIKFKALIFAFKTASGSAPL